MQNNWEYWSISLNNPENPFFMDEKGLVAEITSHEGFIVFYFDKDEIQKFETLFSELELVNIVKD